MRSIAFAASLLALMLLGMLVYLRVGDRGPTASPTASARDAAAESVPSAPALDEKRTERPSEAPVESQREAAAPTAATPAPNAAIACNVFGRVVDENDDPLAGVSVRLQAYGGWAEGQEIARLPGRHDYHGWEVLTDTSGSFHFSTPVPTVSGTWLSITPDPFHDSARESFSDGDARNRPPLHAGDNDLGVFRLVSTGAIRGSVTDESGRPLENAHVRIADDRWSTLGRECDSDSNGRYLIAHIKEGSYGVNAECQGYLSEFKKPFQVDRGRVTEGVDFALRVAPTLSGVVVDEQARGLPGARLWGWPSSSGAGAGATSGAEGSFTIHLPQDEPYTLEVKLAGYDSFGINDRSTHYAPNTRDLRIVLKRSATATTRFVVVDAETGAAVEHFGLEIERDWGRQAARSTWTSYRANPQPVDHPGGELETAARPGLDRYTVMAPGYVRVRGEIQHEAPDSTRQVVRLDRGGILTGRVVSEGRPVAAAAVRLEAGSMESLESSDDDSPAGETFETDVDNIRTMTTGGDGLFRFEMLDAGTYRLVVSAASGKSCEVVPLEIERKGAKELGDLTLVPSATILGQVLVPARRSAAGLKVYLDDWRHDVKQFTDAQGRFRFDGVLPGEHTLLVDEAPAVLASCQLDHVVLAAGESREVVIDARDRGTCNVVISIELTGQSAEGLEVALRPVVDPDQRIEIGRTDAKGRVAGWAPASGDARVVIAMGWRSLEHPTALVSLVLDRDVETTARFEVGSLVVELPGSVTLPDKGSCGLSYLRDSAGPEPWTRASIALGEGPSDSGDLALEAEGRRIRCGFLMPGRYEFKIALYSADAPLVTLPLDGGFRMEREALFEATFSASIEAGETHETRLR